MARVRALTEQQNIPIRRQLRHRLMELRCEVVSEYDVVLESASSDFIYTYALHNDCPGDQVPAGLRIVVRT